jgi:hypothetical protein
LRGRKIKNGKIFIILTINSQFAHTLTFGVEIWYSVTVKKAFFNFNRADNMNKTNNTATPTAEKYFAVVHTGQGKFRAVVEDTQNDLTKFLRDFCHTPTDIEAMGVCNKQGVLRMTNPDKFDRKWLNQQIKSQMWTIRDLFARERRC